MKETWQQQNTVQAASQVSLSATAYVHLQRDCRSKLLQRVCVPPGPLLWDSGGQNPVGQAHT
jgi:hypothetical protein